MTSLTLALALTTWMAMPDGDKVAREKEARPEPLPLERSLRTASMAGKFAMLLRQLAAPDDFEKYGDFRELGSREVNEHAGAKDLPKGYWVYVYPYWYIWRDIAALPKIKRPW